MFPYTSIATVIIVGSKVLPYATLAEEQVRKTQLEKPSAKYVCRYTIVRKTNFIFV